MDRQEFGELLLRVLLMNGEWNRVLQKRHVRVNALKIVKIIIECSPNVPRAFLRRVPLARTQTILPSWHDFVGVGDFLFS